VAVSFFISGKGRYLNRLGLLDFWFPVDRVSAKANRNVMSVVRLLHSIENILISPINIVGIYLAVIMRSLAVVATTLNGNIDRFAQGSLREARNLKDFLEQTGEFKTVTIYESEKTVGPLTEWVELKENFQ
jgi:hypothetical protein